MPDSAADISYDQVTYPGFPYIYTQPDRLGAIGRVFGMQPADGHTCRVLEIGGGGGENLIPLAERFPQSEFLGIDLSSRQVAAGRSVIERLGLKNIRLDVEDLCRLGADAGEFDYIVAHGVYAWAPPDVAEKLLDVCAARLKPQGMAYISYNAYPGWHFRQIIRDLFLYQSADVAEPVEKVRQGREALSFLARFAVGADSGYRAWITKQEARLRDWDPSQLLHDELEAHNHPCYFHEFVERARRHGLKYVADAQTFVFRTEYLPPQVAEPYRAVARTPTAVEQMMDYLQNTSFRRSILCRRDVELTEQPSVDRILELHVGCSAKPKAPVDLRQAGTVTFDGTHGPLSTADPLVKAMLMTLGQAYPRTINCRELIRNAHALLGTIGAAPPLEEHACAARLLPAMPTAEIELWSNPPEYATELLPRPVVSPYARLQAESTAVLTGRRHATVHVDPLTRQVAFRLDGTRDREALADEISGVVADGSVQIRGLDLAGADRAQIRQRLLEPIQRALVQLAAHALLIG